MSDMLNTVIREISRSLGSFPSTFISGTGRLAYRLHPDDFRTVLMQAMEFGVPRERDALKYDGSSFYLLGMRVFRDAEAPRVLVAVKP